MKYIIPIIVFPKLLIAYANQCNKIINKDAVISLEQLSTDEYNYTLRDNSTIYFRLCSTTTHCSSEFSSAQAVIQYNNNTCEKLADVTIFNNDFIPIDANDLRQGITIEEYFLALNYISNSSLIDYVLYCNPDQEGIFIEQVIYKNSKYKVYAQTENACPLVMISSIFQILQDNILFVSLVCMVIGIIECLFGKRLLQPTLFFVGYISGFLFSLFIFSELLSSSHNVFYLWIAMMISVFFGAFIGAVAMQLHKIGILIVGISMGIILSLLIWNALIRHATESIYLFYAITIIMSGIFAYLSWKIFDHLIIFSTSLMGSYLSVRSISWILGGYPSELQIFENISQGSPEAMPNTFYIYFIVIIILAIFGIRFQYKQWKEGIKQLQQIYHDRMLKQSGVRDNYVELQDLPDSIIISEAPIQGLEDSRIEKHTK